MGEVTRILVFLTPIGDALERCEEYYTTVHVGLIARTLGGDPRWLSYYQDRLVAQYDANKGFNKSPERWRMVHLRGRTETEENGLAARPNNIELQRVIELDHQNFLGDLIRVEAVEDVLHNTLGRQVALQKYSVIFRSSREVVDPGAALDAAARELVDLAKRAGGLRMAALNRVIGQVGTEQVGMSVVPSSSYVERPEFSGVLELWFDNRFTGEDFFAIDRVNEIVNYGALPAEAYKVAQTAGFDKRDLA